MIPLFSFVSYKWILSYSEHAKQLLDLNSHTKYIFYPVTFPHELLTQLGQPLEEHGCLSGGPAPSQAAAGSVLAPPLACRRLQDTCLLRQPSPQVTEHLDHTDTAQL